MRTYHLTIRNMDNAKKCRACATEIPKEAKVCPNCKTDQRNWFARHYVLTALLAIGAYLV